jgi:hypothetical protein
LNDFLHGDKTEGGFVKPGANPTSPEFTTTLQLAGAFSKAEENSFVFKTHRATRGVNFYSVGVVTHDRRIWLQFSFCNNKCKTKWKIL